MGLFSRLGLLALVIAAGLAPAAAAPSVGVVLLHGKTGTPGQMAKLSAALAAAGYAVDVPELCWSQKRIFDRSFADCLVEVDAAVDRLKAKGAAKVVVGGTSQGAIAAIAYGAAHPNLAGVVAMVPAADPVDLTNFPGLAAGLKAAADLVKAGQGDKPTELTDIVSGGKDVSVKTTANIYLSFHAKEAAIATMPNLTAKALPKLTMPFLWVKGSKDPSQAPAEKDFAAVPKNKLSRLVVVDADHVTTPDVSADAVIAWLKGL